LGLFAWNTTAVQGALIQMVNHGLSTGALFLVVGMIYDRRHTRQISDFGGITSVMPVFAVMFMIATLASIGLPGLNGFVGEFLILNGTFSSTVLGTPLYAILAATGVILAAVYMLWMYRRVMFGPINNEKNRSLTDLDAREIGLLVPMMVFMIWIGVRPIDFMKYSEVQIENLLEQSRTKSNMTIAGSNVNDLPDWTSKLYGISPEVTKADIEK
jgi:NADH-quinone oxidoreductase subunit M